MISVSEFLECEKNFGPKLEFEMDSAMVLIEEKNQDNQTEIDIQKTIREIRGRIA